MIRFIVRNVLLAVVCIVLNINIHCGLMGASCSCLEATLCDKTFRLYMVLWDGPTDLEKGFIAYLKRKNIKFDVFTRDCKGDRVRCHGFIPEIREMKPDLIYVWGTPACEEIAGKITQPKDDYIWDIPIISVIVTDPVNANIIKNLDTPGRNVTGVNHVAPVEAQLNTILFYKRDTRTIAVIYNPDETNSVIQVEAFSMAAERKGIKILNLPIPLSDKKADANRIIELVLKAHTFKVDFIYIPADTFVSHHSSKLIGAANRLKIPTFASTESLYWNEKPLIGMISKFINVGAFAGFKAYEILINKKDPATIPYERLSRFSILISKSTYENIGLVPPITLLKFAEIED